MVCKSQITVQSAATKSLYLQSPVFCRFFTIHHIYDKNVPIIYSFTFIKKIVQQNIIETSFYILLIDKSGTLNYFTFFFTVIERHHLVLRKRIINYSFRGRIVMTRNCHF